MFAKFVDLQDRVHAIVNRAEAILRDPDNKDVAALGTARWELARTLREYQLFKHSRIFDPLERGQDYRAIRARRMKADCIRVGEEFRAYVLKWSVVSILDHWSEYHPAALDAVARIRAHLARERVGVAELLDVRPVAA
jgi:hypothetical protein